MKATGHPTYYPTSLVTCSCGNSFETGSTMSEIKTEICSACHPFFTGEMRFVDTQGRVDRFESARKRAEELKAKLGKKKAAVDADAPDQADPKTLKEMLEEVKKNS